jgi:hypothetical protein
MTLAARHPSGFNSGCGAYDITTPILLRTAHYCSAVTLVPVVLLHIRVAAGILYREGDFTPSHDKHTSLQHGAVHTVGYSLHGGYLRHREEDN